MTKIVKEEIADFWKGVNVAPDKLTYDADQILMIYVYIIAKSKIRNLFAHLHMCQEFSTNYVMTTRVGYCYTTMEIALTMLLENSDLIDMTALYDEQTKQTKMQEKRVLVRSFIDDSLRDRERYGRNVNMTQSEQMDDVEIVTEIINADERVRSRRSSINSSLCSQDGPRKFGLL